jgi:hypothetical protein
MGFINVHTLTHPSPGHILDTEGLLPRRLRSATLETRTARLKLDQQRKPYWITVAPGIALGYRRNEGAGTWNVRCADGAGSNWIKSFGLADDHEDADGASVLTFWQAADRAKALARGKDVDAGRPATIAEALYDYAADLKVRGAGAGNASRPRRRLPPALLSKPVSMLTVKELRGWRNGLAGQLKPAGVNRLCKALKAALNLAAAHDDRITNVKAWAVGLAGIPANDDTESNLVLTDESAALSSVRPMRSARRLGSMSRCIRWGRGAVRSRCSMSAISTRAKSQSSRCRRA